MKNTIYMGELINVGSSIRRYGRILLALLRQEEETRRRSPMESIVNLFEPVIIIGTMAIVWWFLDRKNSSILGGDPVLFFATGFFAKYFFIYVSRKMNRSVESPTRRFPIERRLDYILVHIVLRVIDYSILGVLLFGSLYLFMGRESIPHDIVPVLHACLMITMLGFGWGVLNVVLSGRFWLWNYIWPALNRVLLIISGVFFIPDFLSPGVRDVLSYNPMMHAIALFRTGFYQHYPTLLLDTTYLARCAIFAIVLGFILERLTGRGEK
jgi:capsular polysaccharide transport system permease protein